LAEAIADRRYEVFFVTEVLQKHASEQGTRIACERQHRPVELLSPVLAGPHPLEDTFAAFRELRDERAASSARTIQQFVQRKIELPQAPIVAWT
jgi:hypothetical protein